MREESGFTPVGDFPTGELAPQVGVGILGYSFMGKAHSNAYRKIPYIMDPPPAVPRLIAMCGRKEDAVARAARRYGYQGYYTDWHKMLENDDIQLVDNCTPPFMHHDPCVAAVQAGKHVLCEKPLARTAQEARAMWAAAQKSGVKHMTGFNYRFVPAVRQIREMIEAGALGKIYHWRAVYLQDWGLPQFCRPMKWSFRKGLAGGGAVNDLGAHIIDLAHYLVGDIKAVAASTKTFVEERALPGAQGRTDKVDVDDAFVASVEFECGALGTLEATRCGLGRRNYNCFEINGEKASVRFNLERFNEFEVYSVDHGPRETAGWTNVLVTEKYHPWISNWWPRGHVIGWEHTFVHEIAHLLDCIVNDKDVGPYGATFEDGYRASVVCDAVMLSAISKVQVDINY